MKGEGWTVYRESSKGKGGEEWEINIWRVHGVINLLYLMSIYGVFPFAVSKFKNNLFDLKLTHFKQNFEKDLVIKIEYKKMENA